MSHIFISYSRKDKRLVEQFVEGLRKQDYIVWQDVSNITAGEKWQQAIFDAIEQAAAVIVFWSDPARRSPNVREELVHAQKHSKRIIPVWLDDDVPLSVDDNLTLEEDNALKTSSYSTRTLQKLVADLADVAPRIQRHIVDLQYHSPMNAQSISETDRQVIGSQEYLLIPLVTSVYSRATLIAQAGTVVGKATRVQLMIQNTGPVGLSLPRSAFEAILAEDRQYPDEAEPLVGLHVTGPVNPLDDTQYWIDSTNVAHYSDMVDTAGKAMQAIEKNAEQKPAFQMFQRTLVDVAFLMGVMADRWYPFQLYKWAGDSYAPIINIPPRIPT
jgi:hypothetical protein